MEVKVEELKFWCVKVINDPDMLPKKEKIGGVEIETTYCNIAVNRICKALGYEGFENMTANQIYDHLKSNASKVDPNTAMACAKEGDVVIAAIKGVPHGHVCVVWPDAPVLYSGKWQSYHIPRVANVGSENGIMGANYAFKEMPEFFRLHV